MSVRCETAVCCNPITEFHRQAVYHHPAMERCLEELDHSSWNPMVLARHHSSNFMFLQLVRRFHNLLWHAEERQGINETRSMKVSSSLICCAPWIDMNRFDSFCCRYCFLRVGRVETEFELTEVKWSLGRYVLYIYIYINTHILIYIYRSTHVTHVLQHFLQLSQH